MINLPTFANRCTQAFQRVGAWRRTGMAMVIACTLLAGMPARAEMPTTPLRDINPGAAGSEPSNFARVGDISFFVANTAQAGYELWKSDGTTAGTQLVKDINPGAGHSSPTWLTAAGNKLFFFADDGSSGMELWVSDGTAAGTQLVKNIAPGSVSAYDINFTPHPIDLNGVLIFGVHYISKASPRPGYGAPTAPPPGPH
jgi:ELWxxDGT repeat protein